MTLPIKVTTTAALTILATLALCAAAQASPQYRVLHSFNQTDGAAPWGGVTLNRGKIYGTTAGGGPWQCGTGECGVVFELAARAGGAWSEKVLHAFGAPGDGSVPYGTVSFDLAGNLYGTVAGGGADGYGTVFALTAGKESWRETILYSFAYLSWPVAKLAIDREGDLYGVTPKASDAYELTPSPSGWEYSMAYEFTGENGDGSEPYAGLIMDTAGNLYGTTYGGGIGCPGLGCGTVYELSPGAGGTWTETVLHRFDNNGKDGITPGWGALYMDKSGSLYGTTAGGGCCGGIVYKLTPSAHGTWKETIIWDFQGGSGGFEPNAGVVMDKSGNLYGTTDYGGNGCGVIYKLAPKPTGKWAYTVLHTFGVGADGCLPEGNLAIDGKGNLYGGTVLGGSHGYGMIFELTP
jgi:uncharacterized repeat protein (TIGR03803 family)